MSPQAKNRMLFTCLGVFLIAAGAAHASESVSEVKTIYVTSTGDATEQPSLFIEAQGAGPRPLLVFLHTWSSGYDLDTQPWRDEAAQRNWHFLQPHFRGPNNTPDACASPLARQDILDAVGYVLQRHAVDPARVYLAGASGGGHMTLVMAAHAPERWAAASAWCAITDLAAWHRETLEMGNKYARDIELCVGGAPGSSQAVDEQLRYRSPVHQLHRARGLPLDLATGIHDGHTGSVPVHHTLDAFNVLANAHGAPLVNAAEMDALAREESLPSREEQDPAFERTIYLRRYAGSCRVTIFEGGHEGLPKAALAFLARYVRE